MNSSSKWNFHQTSLASPAKWKFLWLCLCIIIGNFQSHVAEWIDQDHLTEYPYCGSMNYHKHDGDTMNSRSVNTEESIKFYRWLVLLENHVYTTDGLYKIRNNCTGSVLTDRVQDDYKMCMNMELPKTQVVKFERKKVFGSFSTIDWNHPIFEKEDPPKDMHSAYSSTCFGDSGSPQMIYIESDYDEPKFVVAAILSQGINGKIGDLKSMKYIHLPCGSNVINEFKMNEFEKYSVKSVSISQSITDHRILNWIKNEL